MPSLSRDCASLHTRDFRSESTSPHDDDPLGFLRVVAPVPCAMALSVRSLASDGLAARCSLAIEPTDCLRRHRASRTATALAFFVSKEEEYVRVYAVRGGLAVDLGARNHNYLLLTLARQTTSDAAEGLPRSACGWMHPEELSHDLQVGLDRINLQVFRLREHFARLEISPGRGIVERRPGTWQLRLGVRRAAVWTL